MRRLQTSRTISISLGITLVALCALGIVAQSGRRVRKSTPVAVPGPEATPAPTPTASPVPTVTFIVGMDKFGDFSRVPLTNYAGVLRSCADRLDDSQLVKALTTSGDISRAEAIRKARAEKEAYTVWLQLRPNTFTGQTGVYDDPNNVYIQYFVFAPVTAKQVTSGNTYPEAYRVRGVRIPSSTTTGDYYLNQAARGAAERILDHFHLRLPTTLPPGPG
jgi:hypothetical protein